MADSSYWVTTSAALLYKPLVTVLKDSPEDLAIRSRAAVAVQTKLDTITPVSGITYNKSVRSLDTNQRLDGVVDLYKIIMESSSIPGNELPGELDQTFIDSVDVAVQAAVPEFDSECVCTPFLNDDLSVDVPGQSPAWASPPL